MEMLMAATETKVGRTAKAATDAAEKARDTAKSAAKEAVDYAFAYPRFEVPEFVRVLTDQTLQHTREAYARMKAAAEETTDILEDSMETTRRSVREIQFKGLDIAKSNADASFDHVRQLLTTSSIADAIQLQTAFARERFEAFMDYSKDVQASLSKAGAEASKPAKDAFDRMLSMAKAA
jgi:phasin